MFSAKVDPNVLWDLSGAHLVASKDVGNSLSHLRTRVAVVDKHTGNSFGIL